MNDLLGHTENRILETGVTSLSKMLKQNATIRTLSLSGMNFSAFFLFLFVCLFPSLHLQLLTTFFFFPKGNSIGPGAIALAEAIQVNQSIRKLNLSRKYIKL